MQHKRVDDAEKWIPSSWEWHFVGEKSLWWRFYPALTKAAPDELSRGFYHECKNIDGNKHEDGERCCALYSLSCSSLTFSVPACCTGKRNVGAASTSDPRTCRSTEDLSSRTGCPCEKLALFDLDGTLIRTKSGKVFPVDCDDWELHNNKVPQYLKRLHNLGYRLVIISNQLGIDRGNCSLSELTKKLDKIQQYLSVPLVVCLCAKDDIFRKPRPGCAAFIFRTLLPLLTNYGELPRKLESSQAKAVSNDCPVRVDQNNTAKCGHGERFYPKIFFVGDAAGRPNDHSSADRLFADNIGIPFFTPEEFFDLQNETKATTRKRNHTVMLSDVTPINPKLLILYGERNAEKYKEQRTRPPQGPELVILVGAPGSGKSTWAKRMLPFHSLVRQDDLKTKAKCTAMCIKLLESGKNVVVDMQNKDRAARGIYVNIARKHAPNCAVRCVAFLWPKEICMHLNEFRSLVANMRKMHIGSQATDESASSDDTRFRLSKVPKLVINQFYAKLELPTKDEGFSEVTIFRDIESDFMLLDDSLNVDERSILGSHLN